MQERPVRARGLAGGAICSVLFALSPMVAQAGDSLSGRVTAVKSADLVTLDYGAGTYDVRIGGLEMDRREAAQREATQFSTDLLLGKYVRMRFDGRTPQGEMVGRIWISDPDHPEKGVTDAGVALVRSGLARRRRSYAGYKYGEMAKAAEEARAAKRGLWSRPPVR